MRGIVSHDFFARKPHNIMPPVNYWHAIPLHYVPHLLLTQSLFSQAELRSRRLPISPRPTATRRDRKLGLDGFVHLSLTPVTPLLIDKIRRGYPHALLEFDRETAALHGAAYLMYNTKSWRHRDDFVPIREPATVEQFLADWESGRYPSAELLIPDALPLAERCVRLYMASDAERLWLADMIAALKLPQPFPAEFEPGFFPAGPAPDLRLFRVYLDQCVSVGSLEPPPNFPFD